MLPMGYGITCKFRSTEAEVYQKFWTECITLFLPFHSIGGWASPNVELLKSDESPLPSGKINMDEASWIASLICLGGLIGNFLFGFIAIRFGRKIPLLFLTIPIIVSWLLILFAQNVYYLYASRWLNGFAGGGIFVVVPAFLSEIASDRYVYKINDFWPF